MKAKTYVKLHLNNLNLITHTQQWLKRNKQEKRIKFNMRQTRIEIQNGIMKEKKYKWTDKNER